MTVASNFTSTAAGTGLPVVAGKPPAAEPAGSRREKRKRKQEAIKLREHQQQCIDAIMKKLDSGCTRVAVQAPTGSGKTMTFLSLIPKISNDNGDRERTLILVPNIDLVRQTKQAAKVILGHAYHIGEEQGGTMSDENDEIVVATYQTLRDPKRLVQSGRFHPADFKLVIVDEAHHASSHSYLQICHYFNQDIKVDSAPFAPLDHGHRVPIIGFTATMKREDKRQLGWAFQTIAFHVRVKELEDKDLLSGLTVFSAKDLVKAEYEDWALRETGLGPSKRMGDSAPSLTRKPTKTKAQITPAKMWARFQRSSVFHDLVAMVYVDQASTRKSTLVFCPAVPSLEPLARAFADFGIEARTVAGTMPERDRAPILNAFKQGSFPVLINCELLTEGTDIPGIDCILLARDIDSEPRLLQMASCAFVGRGMRPAEGKTDCLVIDFFDSTVRNNLKVKPTLR